MPLNVWESNHHSLFLNSPLKKFPTDEFSRVLKGGWFSRAEAQEPLLFSVPLFFLL